MITASQRARELHAAEPGLSLAQIGQRCGLSKQGVLKALRARATRGRPRLTQAQRVERALHLLAEARAGR